MRKLFLFVLLSGIICFSCSKSNYPSGKPILNSPNAKLKMNTELDLQSSLKFMNATVDDMKKHVSVDNGCPVDKIFIKDLSEQLGNAIYVLDVCGTPMKYRRTGSVFFKDGEEPYKAQ